jgi:hypothetical protein
MFAPFSLPYTDCLHVGTLIEYYHTGAKIVYKIVIHLGQAIHYRMRWLLPTAVLAGVAEVLGWSARLWSSKNPPLSTPFTIQ